LPVHIRQLFNNSYILPYINDCSTVWREVPPKNSERITKFQTRAARTLFTCLNYLPFTPRVKYQKLILIYKIVNGLVPDYLMIHNPHDEHRSSDL